jgi:hypothetical protein
MVWLEPGVQLKLWGAVYSVPSTIIFKPEGDVVTVIFIIVWAKLATTFFGPFIVMETGFWKPLRSPDQEEKTYPEAGVA